MHCYVIIIQTAIHSTSFLKSCRNAFHVIARNILTIGVVNAIAGRFLLELIINESIFNKHSISTEFRRECCVFLLLRIQDIIQFNLLLRHCRF